MEMTTVDVKEEFVQSVLDSLHRDRRLGEAISLAHGKCESAAGVIDLIFPLITQRLRIDYILMLSIENNPRVLLQFLRLVESRLVQNDSWTVASVEASLRSAVGSLNLGWDRAQRLLKCCILFSDSPLEIVRSIMCLGKQETSLRLRSAAENIELSHLIS
ncbi:MULTISPECIES: hypothetical protein [Paraburkholderia]|uniref:Aminoacyl-tRNA synthetase class I anticodon-binding domain-containing protein n=1 Tax=Paraburkholderia megapolitana TaxID=420953 RepID=A0A1I3RM03_9BURK|nr:MULTISPECIES: hypothetical protein [Paraburkholderia]MCX4165226.1 hypothetical protein [Paraburkholderia megapolitana]MDN7160718.1 hypothetical protein [Paraburkholderia sp. CHISQ3]MDQ6497765.1 hypothetical protein [Paraburkholderia megapolitana]QDQ83929.1 hypothetical protein FNZ07_22585 [Paraburkholderia megapolitana]SFJ46892.1 hypothetical protein SAMN05192543_107303 [Paraburkholderia megapolitana]